MNGDTHTVRISKHESALWRAQTMPTLQPAGHKLFRATPQPR
jgi:hypothetical protein